MYKASIKSEMETFIKGKEGTLMLKWALQNYIHLKQCKSKPLQQAG